MVPRRDYEDYSKYVNDSHMNRKEMLTGGIQMASRTASAAPGMRRRDGPSLDILATKTASGNFFNSSKRSQD